MLVMEVNHNTTLVRDEAFYRRGCGLIDTMKERLAMMGADETLTDHILYAQCGLIDSAVMSTASNDENCVWRRAPLEGLYLNTLRAGDYLPERVKTLLRQSAPDMRLLVLYQRIYTMGFARNIGSYLDERRQVMESLNALVPAAGLSQSSPLLVEHRPRVRDGLLRSRFLHIALFVAITAALWYGLSHSLSQLLHSSLSGSG